MARLFRLICLLLIVNLAPASAQNYCTPSGLQLRFDALTFEGIEGERLLVRRDEASTALGELLPSQRIQRAANLTALPKGTRLVVG